MVKKLIIASFLVLLGTTVTSCGGNTIKEDAQMYCDCVKEYVDSGEDRAKCTEIMKEVIDKYKFSPDDSEVLREELVKCISSEQE